MLADFHCILLVFVFSKHNSTMLHSWAWHLSSIKGGFLPFEEVYLYVLHLWADTDLSHPLLTFTFNFWLSIWAKMNFKMRTVTCQHCFLCAAFLGVEERLPLRVRDRGSRLCAILTVWLRPGVLFWPSCSSSLKWVDGAENCGSHC